MSNKLITLITGANQGIGYYAAQQMAASGKYHVLLGSRDQSRGQKAVDAIIADTSVPVKSEDISALQIDLSSDSSIDQAAETVKSQYGFLDILVNNAGISVDSTAKTTREQFRAIYDTNVFGTAACTEAFIPLLKASTAEGGKRVIFTSSSTGSMELATMKDSMLPANLYTQYRSSKSALNMVMAGFAATLEPEGFVVGAVCPGYCGTSLNDFAGYKHARDGAKIIVEAVEGKKEDVSTKVIHFDGPNGERGAHPW